MANPNYSNLKGTYPTAEKMTKNQNFKMTKKVGKWSAKTKYKHMGNELFNNLKTKKSLSMLQTVNSL